MSGMTDIAARGYAKPRRPRLDRLGRLTPRRPQRAPHRIERGHAALPVGAHPRRGPRGLDGDLNDPLRRDYITRDGFENLMSRIGATPNTTVVFYGDKNNWWACYAFWVFQLFGHTNARIMDGGRIKWEKEGRELTRDVPAIAPT